jgi:hypothetical protein
MRRPAVTPVFEVPVFEVTVRVSPHSIESVLPSRAKMLTKRRAVDFCHVATAICPQAAPH